MRTYRELIDNIMQDPKEASEYLKVSFDEYMNDGNLKALMLAVRSVVKAQGGIAELSRKTSLNRQDLYKTFSKNSNPRLHTFYIILNALGLKLSVEPIQSFQRS